MNTTLEINYNQLWDGSDQATHKIANLTIRMEHFDFVGLSLTESIKRKLLNEISPKIQQLLDNRFGEEGVVLIENYDVRSGSIEFLLGVVTVGGAVYTFFKDYGVLRKNFLLFVDDIQNLRQGIITTSHRILEEAVLIKNRRRKQQNSNRNKLSN